MRKQKISLWGMLVTGIIVISIVTALINRGNPLPGYRGSGGEEVAAPAADSSASASPAPVVVYENETPPFTVEIPESWIKVLKNGYATWIDKAMASSFQIQIGDSDPAILEVTQDSITAELEAIGAELVQFYWMDEWNFACMYRTFTDSGSMANIEITAFNRQHIVRFVFLIDEGHYSQLEGTVGQVIDSFVWDRFAS